METTTKFPNIGKVSPEFFNEVIYPFLGSKRRDVLVGPQHGVDTGIIKIGDGNVLAVTTDPIYIVPQYGWEKAAWFAWHILASDITTTGFPPSHVIVDFNLPMGITEEQFQTVWRVFHRESEKYGASIVAGHTARYTGTDYPMVGGATFLAVGPEESYLSPRMAKADDVLVVTKGAAIEATGIFANTFPETVRKNLGENVYKEASALFYKMSTVEDALTAVIIGVREEGVTAMHDATECGVIGGIFEVAQSSRKGVYLKKEKIPVLPSVKEVCSLFGMDPYISISEGTLVITVRPHKVDELLEVLGEKGIEASIVGELTKKREFWIEEKGIKKPLVHPRVDPFWPAIDKAFRANLK